MTARTRRAAALPCLVPTFREARGLLRIRYSELLRLAAEGEVTVVPWGKGKRITLESIQALARRGYTEDGKPSRAVSRPRRVAPVQGRIRDLEVDP
jgi:hypothetical protein